MSKKQIPRSWTRRQFLERSGVVAGALWLPRAISAIEQKAPSGQIPMTRRGRAVQKHGELLLHAGSLKKFVDPLPLPPVARPAGLRANPADPKGGIPYYSMPLRQFAAKLHRDLPPTTMWGVAGCFPGPTFEARKNEPILVEWANHLPQKHLLAVDHAIHGAGEKLPEVRAVMHLHGGRTPAASDGYPEAWRVPGESALYHYPNGQDAAMLWYHDHTLGITRLNVFAGLFGVFLLRDGEEEALPLPRGKFEVPLAICDRALTRHAQLAYPEKWVNEFSGDAVLVNGKIFPYFDVEPRRYRFRVLNGANSRIFDFSFSSRQKFLQIGSDQGLLPAAVEIEHLPLAPGERADLIVDFSGRAGESVVLQDDSAEDDPAVMQFRVAKNTLLTGQGGPGAVSKQQPGKELHALPAISRNFTRLPESAATRTRTMMLSDVIVNSDVPVAMLLNNTPWSAPVTEKVPLNSVEIWELANVTDEAHPIHLHLARFQVLDRRRFDVLAFQEKKVLNYAGPPVPPLPGEAGWKDTVQATQGMVTRIIARFENYTGRYVWHCHVLEHEDNQMMRPFDVISD